MSTGPIIRIPPTQRTNSEGFNRWANQVRDALIGLRDRYNPRPKRAHSGKRKPFAISVLDAGANWTAKVAPGIISFPIVYRTSGNEARIVVNKTRTTEVTLTGLADNTTYGIWLETTYYDPGTAAPLEYGLNPIATESLWSGTGATGDQYVGAGGMLVAADTAFNQIVKSSTYTEAGDVADYVNATDNGAVFLGQVDIASGVVTIDQWVEENIQIPALTWGHGTISTDPDNSISSDGGAALYIATPVVSADANNSISAGTDGGAYYDAP